MFRHDLMEQLVFVLNQLVDCVFVVSNLVLMVQMMVQNLNLAD